MAARFDLPGLYESIDTKRATHNLTWAALSRQVGVAPSTIRRLGRADDAEADGVLALIRWLGATPEDHVVGGSVQGSPLTSPLTSSSGEGQIRVDMELVAEAAGDRRGARGRTRTTIQRLVDVAERAERPIATLTRFSEC